MGQKNIQKRRRKGQETLLAEKKKLWESKLDADEIRRVKAERWAYDPKKITEEDVQKANDKLMEDGDESE